MCAANGSGYHPVPQNARCDIVSIIVNDQFKALAHPIRRGIVERLATGPATVGDATGGFGVSKPAITRHVKVLEDAGVVVRTVEGRTHRLGLDLSALTEAVDWVDRQRAIWQRMFDVVEEILDEQESRDDQRDRSAAPKRQGARGRVR
jgi:DNA-binding transcriptional ArsR family regulator